MKNCLEFSLRKVKKLVEDGDNTRVEGKFKLEVDLIGVEEAVEKAERFVELLKEAKTLADELASKEFEIGIKQD